jgi:hypothetical protein
MIHAPAPKNPAFIAPSIEEWKAMLAEREKALAEAEKIVAEQATARRKYVRRSETNKRRPSEYQRACARVIADMVAVVFGVTRDDIYSRSRKGAVVAARQCLAYELFHRVPGMFLSELARHFGLHHTTLMHALKKEEKRRAIDPVPVPPVLRAPVRSKRRTLKVKPHVALIPYAGRNIGEGFMRIAVNPYRSAL